MEPNIRVDKIFLILGFRNFLYQVLFEFAAISLFFLEELGFVQNTLLLLQSSCNVGARLPCSHLQITDNYEMQLTKAEKQELEDIVKKLLESNWCLSTPHQLSRDQLVMLTDKVKVILMNQPMLLELSAPINICGRKCISSDLPCRGCSWTVFRPPTNICEGRSATRKQVSLFRVCLYVNRNSQGLRRPRIKQHRDTLSSVCI